MDADWDVSSTPAPRRLRRVGTIVRPTTSPFVVIAESPSRSVSAPARSAAAALDLARRFRQDRDRPVVCILDDKGTVLDESQVIRRAIRDAAGGA